MLYRLKPPNQGLWNGVGGHLEPGETPRAGALREVYEETGFLLPSISFSGVLTWDGFETPPGGLFIFTAPAPEGEPKQCSEGDLAWKHREWVFTAPEVVSNIHVFGPLALDGTQPQEYYFSYRDGMIARYEIRSLPGLLDIG